MARQTQRPERRTDALSKERIVEVAVAILDTDGERALTFRALASRLSTGPGAIYWHVASKDELLVAATDHVIAGVTISAGESVAPREAVRDLCVGVFDAIDAHPWVGAQLSREPWQPAVLQVLEGVGGRLQALGVADSAQFDCASALVNYILGLAGQYAAGARLIPHGTDRAAFLETLAARWAQPGAPQSPFLLRMAAQLREHDDREQFLAGIDLILAGISTLQP